ncbi:MAG: hypothetical protein L3J68_00130 [Thermoplasmata archaeon]|nr:hypothetical protein [Thermoplasmata archaeon]
MAPKPTTTERIDSLRREPEVARWYNDQSVHATAETQLTGLEIFLRRAGFKTAGALLALAKKDPAGLQDRVVAFLAQDLKDNYSQKYSINLWYGARAFLKYNNAAPAWNPKAKKRDEEEDGGDREIIPTFDQMRQIASVLPARARAAALLVSSSGIRIGVLGAQFEADGLRLRHLPELVLDGPDAPRFRQSKSFLIRVPKHLSKNGKGYVTFGNADAADALLSYLRSRTSGGETLTPASPVIAADPRGHASERKAKDGTVFVSRKSLAFTIAEPMRRVAPKGVYWHTYLFRKWFSVQMEGCESRGLITKTRREALMGHLSTDTIYNLETNEGVGKLRESYESCVPFLSLSETDRRAVDTKSELLASLQRAIEKEQTGGTQNEDLAKALKAIQDALRGGSVTTAEDSNSVSASPLRREAKNDEEARPLILAGWDTIKEFPDGSSILQRPI